MIRLSLIAVAAVFALSPCHANDCEGACDVLKTQAAVAEHRSDPCPVGAFCLKPRPQGVEIDRYAQSIAELDQRREDEERRPAYIALVIGAGIIAAGFALHRFVSRLA